MKKLKIILKKKRKTFHFLSLKAYHNVHLFCPLIFFVFVFVSQNREIVHRSLLFYL